MPHTESVKRQRKALSQEERPSKGETDELERIRPRIRADCVDGPRPCPFFSCRFHLGIHVMSSGGVRYNYDGEDGPLGDENQPTCTLDVADRQELTLESIGGLLSVSRERIRQIEESALIKLRDGLRGESR